MDETGGVSPKCVKVHMISHRYATGDNVQIRDRLTYHSFALLEWDHKRHCTVVELAYLGGVGGYAGRANWVEVSSHVKSDIVYNRCQHAVFSHFFVLYSFPG